ncbi:hypothetical protein [Candidatus Poriferisodalis sp.]|uniref:hypothetical protein n=1 Tax=Candidatus Poriferisodalis sp. TaxID=3101277 RepID=UPI003AF6CDC8
MHTVRVYRNTGEGTNWWAEDDLGFTGGADHLSDLMASIREWAEAEGVLDDLSVSLVDDATEAVL